MQLFQFTRFSFTSMEWNGFDPLKYFVVASMRIARPPPYVLTARFRFGSQLYSLCGRRVVKGNSCTTKKKILYLEVS